MNRPDTVNSVQLRGAALERVLAGRLRVLLGEIPWLKGWKVEHVGKPGFSLRVKLPAPKGGYVSLHVYCRQDMRPSQFHDLVERAPSLSSPSQSWVPVLAMPFITERMADLCNQHGWGWYDSAGNCRISVPGFLFIERTGLESPHERARPSANYSTPQAARVIRAILSPMNGGKVWTQRALQSECQPGVSIGLVNKVVRRLCDEAFVDEMPQGGVRLRDPVGLLMAWREVYRFDRHLRNGYFTLLKGARLKESLSLLGLQSGGHVAYAAFSAAEFQSPHVRQPRVWLYVKADFVEEACAILEAKQVDSGENLIVVIPEDEGVFYLQETDGNRLPCTNPVQTYVDLYHCGSRGEEAADALLEQNLKPEWRIRGLL